MAKVLIVEDHRLFADAIRSPLERLGLEVLEVAATAAEGLETARRERPDLALVDIGLPDESGLSLGRKILEEVPGVRVVALTSLRDGKAVSQALRLGFQGYITKDAEVDVFTDSIAAVLNGQAVVPRRFSKDDPPAVRSAEEREAAVLIEQLTTREREVLTLLTEGASGGEIAARLAVSPNTVRTHIQNVLTKLQVHSRLEAAAFAVRWGVVKVAKARGA